MTTFRTIKPVSFREGDKKRLIPRKTHLCNEEQKTVVLIIKLTKKREGTMGSLSNAKQINYFVAPDRTLTPNLIA